MNAHLFTVTVYPADPDQLPDAQGRQLWISEWQDGGPRGQVSCCCLADLLAHWRKLGRRATVLNAAPDRPMVLEPGARR